MNFNNSKIKIGFIFDLDGTLIDDKHIFIDIPLKLKDVYKIDLTTEKINELKNKLIEGLTQKGGKSLIVKLILDLAKELGIPWYKRFGFLKKISKEYQKNLKSIKLFDNELETLKQLKYNFKSKIAILTTSSVKETIEKCKKFDGFIELFDEILGRDNLKNLKPNPEGILKLGKKWDIKVSNIIMVGDMKNDILCGKNAGCITIGVLSGFSTLEQMKEWNADFIINHIGEIPLILNKIFEKLK